jgi:hypothetical protein
MPTQVGEKPRRLTPVRAIREKCLDCSCGSVYEVTHCRITSCALWTFRLGKNPNRAGIGGAGNIANLRKQAPG